MDRHAPDLYPSWHRGRAGLAAVPKRGPTARGAAGLANPQRPTAACPPCFLGRIREPVGRGTGWPQPSVVRGSGRRAWVQLPRRSGLHRFLLARHTTAFFVFPSRAPFPPRMSLVFDEYGRPFILMREQESKSRIKGLEAQKVSAQPACSSAAVIRAVCPRPWPLAVFCADPASNSNHFIVGKQGGRVSSAGASLWGWAARGGAVGSNSGLHLSGSGLVGDSFDGVARGLY